MPLKGLVNFDKEIQRLTKELQGLDRELTATLKKLSNEAFIRKAPPEVVDKAKVKQEELEHKKRKLKAGMQRIQEFSGP